MNRVDSPVDVNAYARELRLLLSLIGMDNSPGLPSDLLDSTPHWDWHAFLRMSGHHRVYPAVYMILKRMNHPAVPQSVMQALSTEYRRNSFLMLQLCGEMQRVGHALEANGLRFLVLKGPILAEALYGDLTMRTSKDLDMLVPPADMERAERILRSCGYEEMTPEPAPFVFRLRKDPGREYHKSYIHSENKVQIELHWRMNGRHSREPSFDDMWEQRRRTKLAPAPVYYLGQEHLFYSLVTHGARHGWFRLRWLADIDRLLRQQRDHEQLLRFMQTYKAVHYGGQAMLLCEHLLGTKPEDPGERRRNADALRLARAAAEVIGGESDLRYKLLLKSPLQKAAFLLQLLYPRLPDRETLPLPKPLHILYFPLRPILWLWRMRKKQSQASGASCEKLE